MKSFINQFWALKPDTKPNVGNTTIKMSQPTLQELI